ncbi:hypothetical protein L6452_22805 [Arctium lappa]|uniref:Uncharacterized protein n=1 Tax=Arctium lappa TaxID=4217 RepID=A0ACB9B074_ARCLA|nr:hypothetical protein L6452_22805 [Arctium lappa]
MGLSRGWAGYPRESDRGEDWNQTRRWKVVGPTRMDGSKTILIGTFEDRRIIFSQTYYSLSTQLIHPLCDLRPIQLSTAMNIFIIIIIIIII